MFDGATFAASFSFFSSTGAIFFFAAAFGAGVAVTTFFRADLGVVFGVTRGEAIAAVVGFGIGVEDTAGDGVGAGS